MKKFKIGIDYGGTKIEGILLNENGDQIDRKRYSYEKNYISGIETVKKLVSEFDNISGEICTVGFGIPGFSSKETGLVTNANSLWLNDKPFKTDLEAALNRKVRLMNDANCFTLSEAVDGAGKNFKSVFGVIIGTGFGGALSYKKEIIEGANQIAGDWGHQPLPYPTDDEIKTQINCPSMNCGRALCAEQFMSGIGFTNIFNKKNNTNFNSYEIVELDRQGDPRANLEFSLYEDRMARLIAVMIGIFDPEAIILGGGMSNVPRLYKNISVLIPKYTFSNQVKTKILKNVHGDSSGVRGAAWLWN
ncbi:ROK family protein [Candidatus Pelagibacter sp.]|nr:ROK family protein [Candidatus Pelagibacter sp.]|tara:strand:- start:45 stop:956 length:912 start_codon:yes stop_codon:yes gene_type:complete